MGYMVSMDENGDAEGNYTIVARTRNSEEEAYGLHPIGVFLMPLNSTRIPVCITISAYTPYLEMFSVDF